MSKLTNFQKEILEGIPENLPSPKPYDKDVSHAPKRVIDHLLSQKEKQLALICSRIGKIWAYLYVSFSSRL
jgi:urocanate hydratase